MGTLCAQGLQVIVDDVSEICGLRKPVEKDYSIETTGVGSCLIVLLADGKKRHQTTARIL